MRIILIITLLMSVGCNGFKQSGLPSFNNDEDGFSSNIDYQLSIQSGPYEGRLVVDQIRNSSIKILVPVGINNFVPLGNFSSAFGSVSGRVVQDANSFKTLEVNVPISSIVHGVNAPIVTTLPNGEPLSFLATGEAQHFSFPLDSAGNVNVHFYLSPRYLIGVFIQTPFDMGSSAPYLVGPPGSFLTAGFFSTHPHKDQLKGGSFVFISLPQ